MIREGKRAVSRELTRILEFVDKGHVLEPWIDGSTCSLYPGLQASNRLPE
jgi:hypothetical protein